MTAAGIVLVHETAVPPEQADGDTASRRVTLAAGAGSPRLEQSVVRFAPGRSRPRVREREHTVLYVAAGRGTIEVDGVPHALEPETGVYVAPGERYAVVGDGPDELVVVAVTAEAERRGGAPRRVTVRYADQPALPASPNREFRYLVNQDAGCADVTQFVGVIPPGRAPMHSHTYDEVIYVLEGEGALHWGDTTTPIRRGSCIHLPPLLLHSLENTGGGPMRVLGVFHPSGDPASRAAVAAE